MNPFDVLSIGELARKLRQKEEQERLARMLGGLAPMVPPPPQPQATPVQDPTMNVGSEAEYQFRDDLQDPRKKLLNALVNAGIVGLSRDAGSALYAVMMAKMQKEMEREQQKTRYKIEREKEIRESQREERRLAEQRSMRQEEMSHEENLVEKQLTVTQQRDEEERKFREKMFEKSAEANREQSLFDHYLSMEKLYAQADVEQQQWEKRFDKETDREMLLRNMDFNMKQDLIKMQHQLERDLESFRAELNNPDKLLDTAMKLSAAGVDMEKAGALISNVINGRATPEDVKQLGTLLNEAANKRLQREDYERAMAVTMQLLGNSQLLTPEEAAQMFPKVMNSVGRMLGIDVPDDMSRDKAMDLLYRKALEYRNSGLDAEAAKQRLAGYADSQGIVLDPSIIQYVLEASGFKFPTVKPSADKKSYISTKTKSGVPVGKGWGLWIREVADRIPKPIGPTASQGALGSVTSPVERVQQQPDMSQIPMLASAVPAEPPTYPIVDVPPVQPNYQSLMRNATPQIISGAERPIPAGMENNVQVQARKLADQLLQKSNGNLEYALWLTNRLAIPDDLKWRVVGILRGTIR